MHSIVVIMLILCSPFIWGAAVKEVEIETKPADAVAPLKNHGWRESIAQSASGGAPVVIEGKSDGSGLTSVSIILTNRTLEGYILGGKAYVRCAQKNWKTEPLLAKGESPGAFMTRLVRGVTPPAKEIDFLLNNGEKLKKNGDVISGDLPDGAAKKLLEDSEKRSSKSESKKPTDRKDAKNARGNVTLWTKGGVVTKYEVRLTGKVDADGKETEVTRTRTIEIKDVGTTKIDLPEAARQKLGL